MANSIKMPLQMKCLVSWENGWKELVATGTDGPIVGIGNSARQITVDDLNGTGLAGTKKRPIKAKTKAAFLESIIPALSDELVVACTLDTRLGVRDRAEREAGRRKITSKSLSVPGSRAETSFLEFAEAAAQQYEQVTSTSDAEFSQTIVRSNGWDARIVNALLENDNVSNDWVVKTVSDVFVGGRGPCRGNTALFQPFVLAISKSKLSASARRQVLEVGFLHSVFSPEAEEELLLEHSDFLTDWAEAVSKDALQKLASLNALNRNYNSDESAPGEFRYYTIPRVVIEAAFRSVASFINANHQMPASIESGSERTRWVTLVGFAESVAETDEDRSKSILFMLLYCNFGKWGYRRRTLSAADMEFAFEHVDLSVGGRALVGAERSLTAGTFAAALRSRFSENRQQLANLRLDDRTDCSSPDCYDDHRTTGGLLLLKDEPSLRSAYSNIISQESVESWISRFNNHSSGCPAQQAFLDWYSEDEVIRSRVAEATRSARPVALGLDTFGNEMQRSYADLVCELSTKLLIATLEDPHGSDDTGFVERFFDRFEGNAAAVQTFVHMAQEWQGTTQELIDMTRLLCSDDEVVAVADSSESYVDAGTSQQTLLNV